MRYQIALNRTRRTTLDRARSTTSTSRTTFRGATPTRGCPRTCVAVSQKRWLTCSRTCSSKKATNNKSDKSNQSPLALHFSILNKTVSLYFCFTRSDNKKRDDPNYGTHCHRTQIFVAAQLRLFNSSSEVACPLLLSLPLWRWQSKKCKSNTSYLLTWIKHFNCI